MGTIMMLIPCKNMMLIDLRPCALISGSVSLASGKSPQSKEMKRDADASYNLYPCYNLGGQRQQKNMTPLPAPMSSDEAKT